MRDPAVAREDAL